MDTGEVLYALSDALSRVLYVNLSKQKYIDVFQNHHRGILTIEAVRQSPIIGSRRSAMSACTSAGLKRSILEYSMTYISVPHK